MRVSESIAEKATWVILSTDETAFDMASLKLLLGTMVWLASSWLRTESFAKGLFAGGRLSQC